MITIIDNSREIKQLQEQFEQLLKYRLNEKIYCEIFTKGETLQAELNYSEEHNIWYYPSRNPENNSYWNSFGLGRPTDEDLNISTVEINFPEVEINRSIAGAFGKDEEGNIYVLHRGLIRGGYPGIGKELFMREFDDRKLIIVDDAGQKAILALCSNLTSKQLVANIAAFIREVSRIKSEHKNSPKNILDE
jgi:hypothetical protein